MDEQVTQAFQHILARHSSGSEVARGGLLQDRLVQLCFREKLFEPSILLLKLFELCGLIDLQTTVFTPPAVVGLLGNTKLLEKSLRSTFPKRGAPRLPEACE